MTFLVFLDSNRPDPVLSDRAAPDRNYCILPMNWMAFLINVHLSCFRLPVPLEVTLTYLKREKQ